MTPSQRPLSIAVIGGGIGGPAAALFLTRDGHRVTVFERAPELGPIGAGILLAPTGLYVLHHLNLLDEVLSKGSRVQRLVGHTRRGKKVLDLRYHNLRNGLFGLGIHRGTLFGILRKALEASSVDILSGREIVSIEDNVLVDSQEARYGPFDVIVVADGARSHLRKQLGLERTARPYGYGALWISAENWGEMPDNILQQVYQGTRKMYGVLPSGRSSDGTKLVSLFWSMPMHAIPEWREAGLEAWKDSVLKFAPELQPIIGQVQDFEQVTIASYTDVRVRTMAKGHVALLGDAAHATSPQLGQGASLALFDAFVLASSLSIEPDVDAALLQYAAVRQRHVHFYQTASKWLTPVFQSNAGWLSAPRDLLMGPLCTWPLMHRELVATMAGVKSGPFRHIRSQNSVFQLASKLAFRGLSKDPETRVIGK